MSGHSHFEVYPDVEGMHRWRLKAANGEIVGQSEAYTRPEDAERGARAAGAAALEAASLPVGGPSGTPVEAFIVQRVDG